MLRVLLLAFIMAVPLLVVALYALFLLCATAPISALSIEKAGQFGDSFGVVTCLFSGLAFSGVLITLLLQRDELKLQRKEIERSGKEHAQNEKLNALAALLGVYHELADKKQVEIDKHLAASHIHGDTGQISEALKRELDGILKRRNTIYSELEKTAGLN